MKKGFSLIELLVGMTLILTIGTIVLTIFAASLRGANKSSSLQMIRQNGTKAMNQITRSIRNARSFEGVSVNGTDGFTDYCFMPNGPTPPLQQYKAVRLTTFEGTTETYRCPVSGEPVMFLNDAPILDERKVFIPSSSCYFTCTQTISSGVPTIGVNFTVINQLQSGSPDQDSKIPFQSSISPRNFTR